MPVTKTQRIEGIGGPGFNFQMPVAAETNIYGGCLVSQLANGGLVPYGTALSGPCIGVSAHDALNGAVGSALGAERCYVESRRAYSFFNGTSGDAFDEFDLIGSVVYGTDEVTAAKTSNSGARQAVGFFMGMQSDGKVRVFVDPALARTVVGSVVEPLTDSTAGVPADTLVAVPSPADTPASADALRDDLVANALPAIRHNFASLNAKLDQLIAALS